MGRPFFFLVILFLGQTQGAGRRKTFQSLPYPESASVIGCDDSSNLSRRLYSSALSSCRRLSPFLKVPGSNSVVVVRVLVRLHSIAAPHQVFLTSSLLCSALLSSPLLNREIDFSFVVVADRFGALWQRLQHVPPRRLRDRRSWSRCRNWPARSAAVKLACRCAAADPRAPAAFGQWLKESLGRLGGVFFLGFLHMCFVFFLHWSLDVVIVADFVDDVVFGTWV